MRLLFSTIALATAGSFQVTPTQKVVQLLNDMAEKGKTEKHAETVQFAAYKQFCEDTAGKKQRAIKAGNRRADSLRAAIAKNEADAKRLGNEIAAHDEDISVWEGDKSAANRVRDIESTDFHNLDKDYSESLDALEGAIAVLKKQNFDRAQSPKKAAEALMQIRALIPAESKHVIDAFLAEDPDNDAAHLAVEAPDAHGYEFQSQGVIDLLAKLKNKFDGEREKSRKEEANSKQAFNLLQQSLTNQVDEAARQRDGKAENRATKLQKKGDDTADLSDTIATRDDDQKYLTDLTATCEQKASDFEKRQQLRADEIKAIEKAVEILSSDAVKGAAEKHLPQLVETATTFVQLRSTRQTKRQERVVLYLKDQADRIHSRVLSALAVRVADDPFHKVKKLIKDLIVRLMEEATQETEKKGWCDTELTNNAHSRKEKTNKVEQLHATVDQLKTSVAKLSEDITQLTQEVSDLDKAVAEAIDLRATEKAKNEATIKDSQEAQEAVARALAVLQEFYAKAGESTALLQAQPEAPAIFDSPYQGQQAESGGVISMLDVIQSDFARLEAETTTNEKSSQVEHRQFLNDSEVDKTQKTKDIEHKGASREDQKQLLGESAEDLVGTQKELDAANAYYDQLKPQCIQSGANYEDRAARRLEEIDSLQEALRILNSEDLA
eukprot:GEMP01023079.1.p1 GENE.GEMP01023079.1~~GEMP01023079.1.p1  ORF type:complete len:667 (+),score=244.74 GEMP01023079.1:63-2063(+)